MAPNLLAYVLLYLVLLYEHIFSPCEEIEDPVMTSSFRTQCSLDSTDSGPPFFGSYLSTSQGQSSSYSISDNPPITVYLPRGQTFIVEPAYTSSGERVLERVCSQLKIDKDKYFLQGFGQVSWSNASYGLIA